MIKFWLLIYSASFLQGLGPYETAEACKAAQATIKGAKVEATCTPTPMIAVKPQAPAPNPVQTVPVPAPPGP